MIILDTNVVSALMSDVRVTRVDAWLDRQSGHAIWTTAITVYELRFGIATLPTGRRSRALEADFVLAIAQLLGNRVLPLDALAADAAARLAAQREADGRAVGVEDTLIAGIAISRKATLATRNVRHFADLDVPVIDPWTA